MVTIATFDEQTKAKHLRDRFEKAGVKADVAGEGALQRVASLSKMHGNAKVKVDERDFEQFLPRVLAKEAWDEELGKLVTAFDQ